MRLTIRPAMFVALTAAALAGCEESPPEQPPANGPNAYEPGQGPVGAPPAGVPDDPTLQLRRLTRGELERSLEHVLGPIELIDAEPDLHQAGFARVGARRVTTSTSGVERISFALEDVLEQVFTDPVATAALTSCDIAQQGCMAQALPELGRRAWRRPLAQDEIEARMALYQGCGEALPGLRCVVGSLLYSPNFMYRVELPTNGVYTGYAMASRLSYFLWGSPPDDALLDAAANGELDNAEGVRQHAARMMEDPRARVGLRSFVDEWFRTERLERIGRDALAVTNEELQFALGREGMLQPWLESIVNAAGEELRRMVEHHVFELNADYLDLLVTENTVVDHNLEHIYNLGYEEGGFPAAIGGTPIAGLNVDVSAVGEDSPEECLMWCVEECMEEGGQDCQAVCNDDCLGGGEGEDDERPFTLEVCIEECNVDCDDEPESAVECREECPVLCQEEIDELNAPFDPVACRNECMEWCTEEGAEEEGIQDCNAFCDDECVAEDEGDDEGDEDDEEFEGGEGPVVRLEVAQRGNDGFALARHLPDSPRRGIMGTMAFLGQLGKQNETSPTRRGLYVMRRILCLEVGEPPDDIDLCHRPEGVSRRDSMENHHMCAQSCAGCHSQMDPIGFAMDKFDTIGRLRTLDDWGFPLNTAVNWRLVRPDGSHQLQFDSLRSMAEQFRELPEATECVTRQVYRFATGRAESAADQATVGQLVDMFRGEGRRLKPFMVAFTGTDAFRRAPDAEAHHAPPTLADIQTEVFGPQCAACHVGQALGGFSLAADDGLMERLQGPSSTGMPYVTPGNLEQSYLWHKVAGTHADVGGAGAQMPPTTAMNPHEIERLRAWIEAL